MNLFYRKPWFICPRPITKKKFFFEFRPGLSFAFDLDKNKFFLLLAPGQ